MFDKRRDEPSNGASSSNIFGTRRKASNKVLATIVKNNTVEEAAIPIIMKQFRSGINNKLVVSLQDNILQKDVHVGIVDGIPFCNECRSNDCAHVGFAVCAEQLNLRSKLE
jgi:hypothetical protein